MSEQDEKAHEHPMLLVIDESSDYRYMRAVGRKDSGRGRRWSG